MEKSPQKLGYSLIKMLISLKIYMKTPNTWDFHHKSSQSKCFYAEYTKNSRYSMRFFQKIGKITVISIILIKKPNKLGRNSEKSDFSLKTSTNFHKSYFYKNYMWIHISKIAKTTIFSTQREVEIFHKLFFSNHPQLL